MVNTNTDSFFLKKVNYLIFFTFVGYSFFLHFVTKFDFYWIQGLPLLCFVAFLGTIIFLSGKKKLSPAIFVIFFFAGLFGFSIQFWWIPRLSILYHEIYGYGPLLMFFFSTLLFGAYQAIFSTSLFYLFSRISKKYFFKFVFSILASIFYFYFLHHYALIIAGRSGGYAFAYPVLPLFKSSQEKSCSECVSSGFKCLYFAPSDRVASELEWGAAVSGNDIYKRLSSLMPSCLNDRLNIILSPESTFPFTVNKGSDVVSLCRSLMNQNSKFLLGTYHKPDEHSTQAQSACLISQDETVFFDKQTLLPFYEEELFKAGSKDLLNHFDLPKGAAYRSLVFLICYEFFHKLFLHEKIQKNDLVVALVNDYWFPESMKKLMENYALFLSRINHLDLLYVSHSGLRVIDFSGSFQCV